MVEELEDAMVYDERKDGTQWKRRQKMLWFMMEKKMGEDGR